MKNTRFHRRALLAGAAGLGAAPLMQAQEHVAAPPFRGYWPILSTAFDASDAIDEAAMARQVEFCVRCGVQGMVWPQLISEFSVLSDEERLRTAELLLKTAKRRIPVIIGVQTPSRRASSKLAAHAAEHGASGVIALPPYEGSPAIDAVAEYYKAIAAASKLPVFIQNTGGAWGPALPTSFVIQMAKDHPRFGHVKEEVNPSHPRFTEYAKSGVMRSIFSGTGGKFLPHDLAHGAHGSMNVSCYADVAVKIWSLYTSGDRKGALALHGKLLAWMTLAELQRGFAKAVLVRRGVFSSARSRNQAEPPPFPYPEDREALDIYWAGLQPYLSA